MHLLHFLVSTLIATLNCYLTNPPLANQPQLPYGIINSSVKIQDLSLNRLAAILRCLVAPQARHEPSSPVNSDLASVHVNTLFPFKLDPPTSLCAQASGLFRVYFGEASDWITAPFWRPHCLGADCLNSHCEVPPPSHLPSQNQCTNSTVCSSVNPFGSSQLGDHCSPNHRTPLVNKLAASPMLVVRLQPECK